MCETNRFHGELLPGMAKYFLDLGYNVDVIFSKEETGLNPFSRMKYKNIRIYRTDIKQAKIILQDESFVSKYDFLYINSDKMLYNKKYYRFSKFCPNIPMDKNKILNMCHYPNTIKEDMYETRKLLTLADFPSIKYKEKPTVVNPHYFGKISITPKNDVTTFICVGNIESYRKNHSILLDAIDSLIKKGITNFKVNLIARFGKITDIDKNIQPYIDFKGRLSYEKMYQEMEKADFFLTLLDPNNPEHDRYITTGSSGSFQLIYGFAKPCLIAEKFAAMYGYNSKNSIIYNDNSDLLESMKSAIEMSKDDYLNMQNSMIELSDKIYKESLDNLKVLLTNKT